MITLNNPYSCVVTAATPNSIEATLTERKMDATRNAPTAGNWTTTVAPPPHSIEATLTERGKRYGAFVGHAKITQELKTAMGTHTGWGALADDQREALEMVAHKIGRILNGDPNYADSWVDIAGYSKLVADRLEGVVR